MKKVSLFLLLLFPVCLFAQIGVKAGLNFAQVSKASDINAGSKSMSMDQGVKWTMERSSIFTTESLFALRSMSGTVLTETHAKIKGCLDRVHWKGTVLFLAAEAFLSTSEHQLAVPEQTGA